MTSGSLIRAVVSCSLREKGCDVASYIGLLTYKDAQAQSGEGELAVGKAARAAAELHGGRFLSIFWTTGDADMVLTYEGRDEAQARRAFSAIEEGQSVTIRVLPALSEGEKEYSLRSGA
jgi:uncharacterized protein with GYD domain